MMMNNKLKILTIVIWSLVLISCEPKKTFESRLIERDGLKYEQNSTEPFTGITSFGKEQYEYKEGKRHGEYTLFNCPADDNNLTNLSESGVYKNNIIVESKFYMCGTNKVGKIFRYNGENYTFWRWWADEEHKANKCNAHEVTTRVKRINGKKEGREEIYEPRNYCNDENKNSEMYLEQIYHYKDGKLDGEYFHYSWDGGYLQEKGIYRNGKKHGLFTRYHKNGNPKLIEDYIVGTRHRSSKEFDEQGRLIRITEYSIDFKDGLETKFKYVNEKQIKISTQEYKHFGNKFGLEIHYNDDGSVKESFCWDYKTDRYTGGIVRITKDDYDDKTQVVSSVKNSLVNCRTAKANYLKDVSIN